MSLLPAAIRSPDPTTAAGLAEVRGEGGLLPPVLVVGSGASRCGTTVTSAILGVTAAAFGREVCIIDATSSGALLPLLSDAKWSNTSPLAEPYSSTSNPGVAAPQAMVADVTALVPFFESMAEDGTAAAHRVVLIDAGARVGTVLGALAAARAAGLAPGLVVVTGIAAAQVAAAYALLKVAAQRGLVAATEAVVVGGEAEAAREAFGLLMTGVRRFLDRPLAFAAHVPEDPSLAVALAAGMCVQDAAPGSPAALALATLAERWVASATPSRPSMLPGAPHAASVLTPAARAARAAPTPVRAGIAPLLHRSAASSPAGSPALAAVPAR